MLGLPIRDGKDALEVNWLEITIRDSNRKITYRNSFITDLPVDADNVEHLAAAGRARWKIENETFNTLKTKGYNLEHNFGHGKKQPVGGPRHSQSDRLRNSPGRPTRRQDLESRHRSRRLQKSVSSTTCAP